VNICTYKSTIQTQQ